MNYDTDLDLPEPKQNEEYIPPLTEAQKLRNSLRFALFNYLMNQTKAYKLCRSSFD